MSMNRFKRERARKKVADILAIANDAHVFQMLWCIELAQSGDMGTARQGMEGIPAGIQNAKPGDQFYIQKWVLEDLANETLTSTKIQNPRRILRCDHWQGFALIYNAMLKVDDAESGFRLRHGADVMQEMAKIGHRQFPWQQGMLNLPGFYRSAYLFGQGDCALWFEDEYGILPTDLMRVGMVLYSALSRSPYVDWTKLRVRELGVTDPMILSALRLLVTSHQSARSDAGKMRNADRDVSARQSVLRRTPAVAFAEGHYAIMAPLRELIIERITNGLYLDVVKAPDHIRNGVAHSFEKYCLEIIDEALPKLVRPAFNYGSKSRPFASPDIIIGDSDAVEVIIECKATRMNFDARFGDDRRSASERGYKELAKGVGQIWRYRSHMRRGLVRDKPAEDLFGTVLTLDPWLRMSFEQDLVILNLAREWCAETDPEILPEDQCPVGFTHIEDFEHLLQTTDHEGVFRVSRNAAERAGWGLNELRKEDESITQIRRPYAFRNRLHELLPWWPKPTDEM